MTEPIPQVRWGGILAQNYTMEYSESVTAKGRSRLIVPIRRTRRADLRIRVDLLAWMKNYIMRRLPICEDWDPRPRQPQAARNPLLVNWWHLTCDHFRR